MHVGRQPVSCGMRPIAVLLTLLLGMVHSGSFAQVHPSEASADRLLFTARHFGVTDGLPHRHITSITQDQRGFIWAATPQGLARFDGYGFGNFTMADGLASNAVRKVACDGNGELWVLHDNGSLDIIDARSIRVRNVHDRFEGVEPQLGTGPVLDLISNREGVIVFAQEKYLIRYGDPGHPFQTVAIECPGAILLSRLTDGGDLWYNCGSVPDAEWPVDLVSQRFTAPDGSASPKELVRIRDRNGVVTNPGRDHSGWKPTGMGGTYVVDSQCGPALSGWIRPLGVTIEPSPPSPGMVVQLEGHGSVRMPLSDDIWLINTKVRRMRDGDNPFTSPVLFDLVKVFPEVAYYVRDVLRDRSGTIWIAGEFGLFQLGMRPELFQRYLHMPKSALHDGFRIRGMVENQGRLHVNTETQGYWILDAATGGVLRSDTTPAVRQMMVSDGAGGLWRGLRNKVAHEDVSGRVDRVVLSASNEAYACWSAAPLTGGRLLLGSEKGLRLTEPGSDTSRTLATGSDALDNAWVWHLALDPLDGVFACTAAGLFRLDANGHFLERWWPGASRTTDAGHFLPADDIRYLYADSIGTFWLATATQGLIRWDREKGEVRRIGQREGMPVASIHAIYPDDLGHLWMPTDNGLVRYHPITDQVKIFTTADGITSNEFNRLAHARGADGRFYFGGIDGVTVFHPAAMQASPAAPMAPLVLKEVFVQQDDRNVPVDRTTPLLEGSPLILTPGDRFFTVDFALLSFQDPALIRYAWRMDGIDSDWNVQSEPHLRFTSMPYGDHVLRIKAQDAEGRWSDELKIPITMIRPVYFRWWFIMVFVLLVAGATYAVVHFREQQLRRMIRMRDRIATDLHDEVGSNLSSIVLFSTAVSKHTEALPEYATGMLQRMKENSKRAMESMNDIVWSVNSGHDSMEDLLDRMHAYAEPLCEAAGIGLEFNIDAGPLTRKLAMEQRKNLYLIFKEAVSNAVRHSRCEGIKVALRMVNGRIELVVEDDGVGLPEATARGVSLGGNGLGNMVRRAGEIGGEVQVMAGAMKGTRVVFVSIPATE